MRRIIAMEPIKMPGGEIHHVTISAGVAMSRPTDTPDSIYKRADELLYEAKNSGKNKVVIEKP
jgi:diguanylate cyclase (GGDEF)-like protein